MIKESVKHLGMLGFFCVFLSACGPESEPQLRVGTNIWPGYEPLYLARNLKYYDDTKIHLVELPSTSEVIHALRNGTLEAAGLTLDEVLSLLENNFELKIILVMDYSNGGDVLLSKPEITSLDKLAGKRVAVETSAVGAIVLDGALEAAKLSLTDVEILDCPIDQYLMCYQSSDAIITFEPARTKLLNLGAKQLFDSSQIPGRILDVLVVTKEATLNNPKSIKQLIDGYFNARNYLAEHSVEAAEIMAVRLGLSAQEILGSFDGLKLPDLEENQSLLEGNPSQLQLNASKLADFLLNRGLLSNPVTLNHLTSSEYLPRNNP